MHQYSIDQEDIIGNKMNAERINERMRVLDHTGKDVEEANN
jgi:hypothetical protein